MESLFDTKQDAIYRHYSQGGERQARGGRWCQWHRMYTSTPNTKDTHTMLTQHCIADKLSVIIGHSAQTTIICTFELNNKQESM